MNLPPGRPGRLAEALRGERFAVTAEVAPPRGADVTRLRETAGTLRGWVDAANVTDNQGARVRMSSLAASVVLLAEGLDPVMQMTCRDRNRIALQSDLVGAGALGVANVLLLTGDHPRFGDHPDAKPVFDLDSVQLAWLAMATLALGLSVMLTASTQSRTSAIRAASAGASAPRGTVTSAVSANRPAARVARSPSEVIAGGPRRAAGSAGAGAAPAASTAGRRDPASS